MKKPQCPHLSWPLNSKEQKTAIKYGNDLLEYGNYNEYKCGQMENDRKELRKIMKSFGQMLQHDIKERINDLIK